MEKNGRHRRSRTVIRSIDKKQEIGHEREEKRREEMKTKEKSEEK